MGRLYLLEDIMKTYRIHFIRHGLTDANLDGRYIGVTDLGLPTSLSQSVPRASCMTQVCFFQAP